MELKFVISKQALFVTALIKSAKIEGWVDLQNELWDKYRLGYQLLQGNAESIFATEDSERVLEKATEEVKLLMSEGMKSDKFLLLLQNAKEYKTWLEKEWMNNKEKVEKELKDIMKVDLPKDTFTVYVMGNLVHIGRHLGRYKFAWGHEEDWPNYSLVYLAHEYLHGVFSSSDLEHAVIELITDNELRVRLNNGGEYFICNGEVVGHAYLREIEMNLLPKWKEYLFDKNVDIHSFIDYNSK
ncbi:hypothetical protein GYA27_04515 [candidate division WWE3 bacterium]|uniref:Uncharacterized protein n=1 Tax=candidate division WWE3 bacterium TaxID=2053526 RepID=A0A7X9DL78_UNCKA|nr:hypothetical protein [candidate division WWE3 bacterium]